jgi:hypothetical protein
MTLQNLLGQNVAITTVDGETHYGTLQDTADGMFHLLSHSGKEAWVRIENATAIWRTDPDPEPVVDLPREDVEKLMDDDPREGR